MVLLASISDLFIIVVIRQHYFISWNATTSYTLFAFFFFFDILFNLIYMADY